jgi:hypothetical protein
MRGRIRGPRKGYREGEKLRKRWFEIDRERKREIGSKIFVVISLSLFLFTIRKTVVNRSPL